MRECVIFDLDGTLLDIRHRLHHVKKDQPDWESFFNEQKNDSPREHVIFLNGILYDSGQVDVIICTARPERYAEMTERMLESYGVLYDQIIYRKEGDTRVSRVTKLEQLELVRQSHEVLFAIDDEPEVVKMWRENGVMCLDVNDWGHADTFSGFKTFLGGRNEKT